MTATSAKPNAPARPLTRGRVLAQSWPIMLANAAGPIVGLVDTAILGRYAGTTALAGIGAGAVIYGIVYWGFGFLRMSTAGLAAQADGADDNAALQAHLARAVPLGIVIGAAVFAVQSLLLMLAFWVFETPPDIQGPAEIYLKARLYGLPATLGAIALMGWFIGISRAGSALALQIVLNVINGALSLWFVAGLGWGIFGVAVASAIAEWCGLIMGLFLAVREIKRRGGFQRRALRRANLLDPDQLRRLGVTNSNIFIRTIALTIGFSFFGKAAIGQGPIYLAGNHILLQFINMIALVLDSFAHVAEAAVGSAIGAKSKARFTRAVRLTSEFAVVFAFIAAAFVYYVGPFFIAFMSDDPRVIDSAMTYLPWCALAPIVGVAAWQFDGIFIGATRTAAMRNASVAALFIYVALHYLITPVFGTHGIWIAFLGYYIARGVTLWAAYPALRRSVA